MVKERKRKSDSTDTLSQATITQDGKIRKTRKSVTRVAREKSVNKSTKIDAGAGGDNKINLDIFKYSPQKSPAKVVSQQQQRRQAPKSNAKREINKVNGNKSKTRPAKGNLHQQHLQECIETKSCSEPVTNEVNGNVAKTWPAEDDIFAQILKAKQMLKLNVEGIRRAIQPYDTKSVSVVHYLNQQNLGCRCSAILQRVSRL